MEGATPSSVTGEGDGRDRAAAASEDAPNPRDVRGLDDAGQRARRKNKAVLKQDADLVYGAGSRIPPLNIGWIEDPLNP